MTRPGTIESAFARVDARNAAKDASVPPSLTTATSLTDASSEPTDGAEKSESNVRSSKRLRTSINSYNEKALAGQISRPIHPLGVEEEDHTTPSEHLLEGTENESRERLLQQSVQALDEDWEIGAMPGDGLQVPGEDGGGVTRRKSTRLDFLDQASTAIEKTTSVLGKRGREAMEAGMEKINALKGTKNRSGLKTVDTEPSSSGNRKKRPRFSAAYYEDPSSSKPDAKANSSKRPSKHWMNQGLYVGQTPDFDPRLTESKNKAKKPSTKGKNVKRSAIMPLPMFAGERMLKFGRDFRLPFDVFSPLPPGQPKPDEWKKTHKNIFIGDAADLWKKAKPLEHSLCVCTKEDGCGESCFNRFMLYECDASNCNIGGKHCTNRAFADLKERSKQGGPYNIGVEVMKTPDRGHGVRANRTFEPNQIIIEYTGEIITQQECDHRMHTLYKDAECYYLMDFDQSMVLDATRGSIARFINHSCTPNCRMIKWTVAGKPRMALFAGDEGIMTGEELTYDYNFDPFSAKNVQECRCGAEGCRGVLGPKPKDIKDALKPITTSKKRKIQQAVEDVVETVTKKRKIAVPASVKSAFTSAKEQTSKTISQAGRLGSSGTSKEGRSKPAHRSKGLKRKSATMLLDNGKKEQSKTAVSERQPPAKAVSRGWKGWVAVEDLPDSPEDETPKEEGGSKWEMKPAASEEENVVRTVRRSNRGTTGKSIKVVALGEDEMKAWK